jgi:2-oxoglutarate dehydrogenase complex dehydrogenase (E1) component-like enzyme
MSTSLPLKLLFSDPLIKNKIPSRLHTSGYNRQQQGSHHLLPHTSKFLTEIVCDTSSPTEIIALRIARYGVWESKRQPRLHIHRSHQSPTTLLGTHYIYKLHASIRQCLIVQQFFSFLCNNILFFLLDRIVHNYATTPGTLSKV